MRTGFAVTIYAEDADDDDMLFLFLLRISFRTFRGLLDGNRFLPFYVCSDR